MHKPKVFLILEYPLSDGPFDVAGIDLLQLPCSHQGSSYVLAASLLQQSHMHLSLIRFVPICLSVYFSVIMGQNLRIKFFVTFAKCLISNKNSLLHIIRRLTTLSKGQTRKLQRFSVTMQVVFRNPGMIGYPMLLLVLTTLQVPLRTKHLTPFCLAMTKKFPYDVILQTPHPLSSFDNYSQMQLHSFQTIQALVRNMLKASHEEMLRKQHFQASPITFINGDSVMKHVPDRSSKFLPKFSGPCFITAKMHGTKFNILDLISHCSVHADRLKYVSVPLPLTFTLLFPLPPLDLSFLPHLTLPSLPTSRS